MKGQAMCDYTPDRMIERILADELVRLAMASDGVREDEIRRVLEQVCSAIIRHNSGRSAAAASSTFRATGTGNAEP